VLKWLALLLFTVSAAAAQQLDSRLAPAAVKALQAEIELRDAALKVQKEDDEKRDANLKKWFEEWFGDDEHRPDK
jgi:hypothetical protein